MLPIPLNAHPFLPHAQPALIYWTAARRRTHDATVAALTRRQPLLAIDGPAGCGRRTILAQALNKAGNHRSIRFIEPDPTLNGIMAAVTRALPDPQHAQKQRYLNVQQFQQLLLRQFQRGEILALVFEPDALPDQVTLDSLLKICHLPQESTALFSIVLIGALPPYATEQGHALPALRPLHPADVSGYIQRHIKHTDYPENDFFSPQAIDAVARLSDGIPAAINTLCRRLWEQASQTQQRCITAASVEQLAQCPESTSPPPAADESNTPAPLPDAPIHFGEELETLEPPLSPSPSSAAPSVSDAITTQSPASRKPIPLLALGATAVMVMGLGGYWLFSSSPSPAPDPIAPTDEVAIATTVPPPVTVETPPAPAEESQMVANRPQTPLPPESERDDDTLLFDITTEGPEDTSRQDAFIEIRP